MTDKFYGNGIVEVDLKQQEESTKETTAATKKAARKKAAPKKATTTKKAAPKKSTAKKVIAKKAPAKQTKMEDKPFVGDAYPKYGESKETFSLKDAEPEISIKRAVIRKDELPKETFGYYEDNLEVPAKKKSFLKRLFGF